MLPETLQTSRLLLRPFSLSDAAAVFAYSKDPDWARYQRTPHPYSAQQAERFVAELILRDRASQPTWAMTIQGDVVGIVSMTFHSENRIAVIGYGVHKRLWGKGMSVEAARAVLDHSFAGYPQLQRVRAHTDARNTSSARVLEKLGFSHEGTLRSNQYSKGEFVDDAVYGLLRSEWPPTVRPQLA